MSQKHSFYSHDSIHGTIRFEADLGDACNILAALADWMSGDRVEISFAGHTWTGESASDECHVWLSNYARRAEEPHT